MYKENDRLRADIEYNEAKREKLNAIIKEARAEIKLVNDNINYMRKELKRLEKLKEEGH